MQDPEQVWMVSAGVLGLIGFAAGALTAKVPAVDASTADAVADLVRRDAGKLNPQRYVRRPGFVSRSTHPVTRPFSIAFS